MAKWEMYVSSPGIPHHVEQEALAVALAVFEEADTGSKYAFAAALNQEGKYGPVEQDYDWERGAKLIDLMKSAQAAAYAVCVENGSQDTVAIEMLEQVRKARYRGDDTDFRTDILAMRIQLSGGVAVLQFSKALIFTSNDYLLRSGTIIYVVTGTLALYW